jgi:hypothetical protein
VEPANVPPVPRAGDAPAVVCVLVDAMGCPTSVYSDLTAHGDQYAFHTAHLYARVPDAATLDARIAAVEDAIMELRVAAGSLKAASDNSTSGTSHLMLRQSSDKRRQSAKVLDALLTDLRAARDAGGRDA